MVALFPLGGLVATSGALVLLRRAGEDLLPALLERHRSGDWGDVPEEDAQENEFSVRYGFRIISSYRVAGERLWVITEADRSITTILLPEEYCDLFLLTKKANHEGLGISPPGTSSCLRESSQGEGRSANERA